MTTEDYVSYPIALALKKAGFDWPCRAHYTNDYVNDDSEDVSREVKFHYDWTSPYDYNRIVGNTSAPFIWQAQKWLREKKGVLLWAYPDRQLTDEEYSEIELTGEWWWDTEGAIRECSGDTYPSYEQAISAGISSALELIEKKGE